ncbi:MULTISPECIES: thiolase family protein [Pseudonocardia]|uniref:3-ketoacyl-CoA thiolase n=2 Tax=Pseudonocardia TaxID=1847 RepID=A0A1Y2N9T5_PSEAH|nr:MULTISPECIES: thiolase family protein [Pseudonocardia]OSY44235.1 3-ketoacyl-CoA thiolase [Pseudonocardia autotrophica]TDN74035.1 acetyl-CoA acetyltransferase [Pseudonocardia autotrophica]BBG04792.1 thiolase [Pseudonocardia autotrophica]GEC23448.1 thiolase [Pseudonocardia saturnea]
MREVVVSGVGMTRFGKHPDRPVSSLVAEATGEALADAGTTAADPAIGAVYYGNVLGGLLQGQESVRGQHAIRATGLSGVPLVNVENACASGATALHQAWLAVASGQAETAVAIGAEKLVVAEKGRAQAALTSALDQERLDEIRDELGSRDTGSVFMDVYARFAAWYQESSGATPEDFAMVAVKNAAHGALNPKAQYGRELTVADVLGARRVTGPLTVPMCAPLSDGAAAVVLTTPERARRDGADPVRLLATALGSGRPGRYGELVPEVARRAFRTAGVEPGEIDVVECHDAAAPAELIVLEQLGLCAEGAAPALLRDGATRIGGRLPVNPSGGLQSKGHPLGATGLAQVVELADQLRGRAGARQVDGARYAVAENAGGYLGPDAAVAAVTVLGGNRT